MTTAAGGADALTRFVVEHAAVRGAYVAIPATARAVLACHPYPPALRRILAELCAACALLASTLEFTGSLIVQLQGDGPVRLLVVECSASLGLRAMAQWDAERTQALGADATLAELAGGPRHGRLVLTLDPKGAGPIYQGIVALESGSVAGLIEHYLATSEQLASRLVLAAADHGAAGLLVQRLPGSGESDDAAWTRVAAAVAGLAPAAMLASGPATGIIAHAFPHEDVRVFKPRDVRFECSCSRERVLRALRIAGAAEVEAIIAERGDVEATCEFCSRRYTLAPEEARALFASQH
ncbi:MAG: Hsp33 family molecular chaperone HslO [Burkholderiales bacterium]|nr:Hsp33 family molecular chaperone HslO [Burkholderiales bacterium]